MMARLSFILVITAVLSLIPNAMGVGLALQAGHRRHWKRIRETKREPCEDNNCWSLFGGGSWPPKSQNNPTPSTPSTSSGENNTSGSDQEMYLSLHNNLRAQHGAGALQWNNTLQTAAQNWANGCVFEHSQGALGPFGENLSTGTGDFDINSAVQLWINEAGDYNPSNPQYSHFTQMVWKSTTQVGCAVASGCSGIFGSTPAKLYVCEYYPAGNVIGFFDENVQK